MKTAIKPRKKAATPTKTKRVEKAKAVAETVLVLRTCKSDMTSHGGFVWPEAGPVEAPDWKPTHDCGNGLHGWLWGAGDWSMKAEGLAIKWLVLEVAKPDVIDLRGKVKFPRCTVIKVYTHWREAMAFIRARLLLTATLEASATGDYGHASATGHYGHASATGHYGHASATGHYGHASATGHYGHASATGHYGWAASGLRGDAVAGSNGVVSVLWWDEKSKRPRLAVGYVGEGGIEGGVKYKADEAGQLVKAE